MNDVITRNIEEKDMAALKSLIVEAWGDGWNLNAYDHDTEFFQSLLEVYLSIFLGPSTFGRVAVMDGKVIGAILCSAVCEPTCFRQLQSNRALHTLALLCATEAERMDVVEHMSVSFQAIGQLVENKLGDYYGCLEFIVVAKQAQGLKIGKKLWNEAAAYFNSVGAESIYLISDSQCNTGFYDHNGFTKVETGKAVYNYSTGQKEFDIYLYDYKL